MTDYMDRQPDCPSCGAARWAEHVHVCDLTSRPASVFDTVAIIRAFIRDRLIEEGNFIVSRENFKTLSDPEFNWLEQEVERAVLELHELTGG